MHETWREIEDLEGLYQVSDRGRVKNEAGYVLKTRVNRGGYEAVSFCVDGVKLYYTVHRLVAKAFLPNPENKPQINHFDCIRTNNNVENLEWCTQSENIRHAFMYGNKSQKGEKNYASKLTGAQVLEIRKRAKTEKQSDLAREFGLSTGNVSLIVSRKTWKHLSENT